MNAINEDEICRAYASLKSASQRLFEAKAKQTASERKLHDYEAYLLVSGKIDGKNEEIRGAQLRMLTADLRAELHPLSEEVNRAQHEYELARLDVEMLLTVIKFLAAVGRPLSPMSIEKMPSA
jgi:hypothetical protein